MIRKCVKYPFHLVPYGIMNSNVYVVCVVQKKEKVIEKYKDVKECFTVVTE